MLVPLGRLSDAYAKEGFRYVTSHTDTERDPFLVVEYEYEEILLHHNAFPGFTGGVFISVDHVVSDAITRGVPEDVMDRVREYLIADPGDTDEAAG